MRILHYIFLIALLFNITPSICQTTNRIDSLMIELNKTVNAKAKLKIQKQLFNLYLRINLDSAQRYQDQILNTPTATEKELAINYLLASKYQYYRYNLDSAKYYAQKVNNIAKKIQDDSLLADTHFKLGVINAYQSKPEEEEFHRSEALKVAKSINDWKLIGRALTGLANQYYLREDLSRATKFYISADSTYKSNNYNGEEAVMVYENLSRIYMNKKDEKALEYANKAEKYYLEKGNNIGLARSYSVKGQYFLYTEENPALAIPFYEKAHKIQTEHGGLRELPGLENNLITAYSANRDFEKGVALLKTIEKKYKEKRHTNIQTEFNYFSAGGQLYADMGEYKKSAEYFEHALKLESIDSLILKDYNLKEVYDVLSDVHYKLANYKRSAELKEFYIKLSDSLNTINRLEFSRELEAKYQSDQKEQEINLLQAQNEAVESQKTNQRNLLLAGLGATSLAGIFLFFLYRNRQKTNKKLQELDTVKSRFFANISHEFRTPLTIMATPLQRRLAQGDIDPKDKTEFGLMLKSNQRLTHLVDQLLELSKLESGKAKLQVSELNGKHFLRALIEPFQYQAENRGIDFQFIDELSEDTIWCDGEALQKIGANLLSNAIKYTSEGGTITFAAKQEKGHLKLRFENTGRPLSEEERQQLFNRFYQADPTHSGVGIGLALVKELVQLHKGTIQIDGSYNKGTAFDLKLPITKNMFKASELSSTSEIKPLFIESIEDRLMEDGTVQQESEKPLVLLVEDNRDLRVVLMESLKNEYDLMVAKDGDEGVKNALEHVPDLIVSDIMMPKKDGLSLTRELKENEITSHIPILLLTAKSSEESELSGVKLGADAYVTKPFNNALLKSKMANLLNVRKKMQARYSQEVILKPKDIAVTPPDKILLDRIQAVMEDHLMNPSFSTEDFARKLGFSRMQLHRKLKALTGLSATEFIRSQRLKLAAQLLEKSDTNVSEVCYQTGFNNPSYFAKCFKEAYGMAPSQYSKRE